MELFERIGLVAIRIGKKADLAKLLGISPQKLSAYSNEGSQKNFYRYLPLLLASVPGLRRDWLYFGEGEMFSEEQETTTAQPSNGSDLSAMVKKQAETIRVLTETNRKLTEELLQRQRLGRENG